MALTIFMFSMTLFILLCGFVADDSSSLGEGAKLQLVAESLLYTHGEK